jgi:hypothetical protein
LMATSRKGSTLRTSADGAHGEILNKNPNQIQSLLAFWFGQDAGKQGRTQCLLAAKALRISCNRD